jgi:hypothetical protein
MGIVRMGVPEDVAQFISDKYNVDTFVETGTFHGDTAVWASQKFKSVKTVEFSKEIYDATTAKHGAVPNIEFLFGDSRDHIKNLAATLKQPALFWLDAHWCGVNSYGKEDQCPLIDELTFLMDSGVDHFILIDDARLFESPPPLPNSTKYYPDLYQILSTLHKDKKRYTCIFEDVIISVPGFAREQFVEFMQVKSTKGWKDYGQELKRRAEIIALGRVRRSFFEVWKIWFPDTK